MFSRLREHVSRRVPLTDRDFLACTPLFRPRRLEKGELIARKGELCSDLSFVTSGCLRAYGLDRKGEEHIVQFGLEGWWITDLYSFLTGQPGDLTVDALERSDVLLIDGPAYEKLCTTVPVFERYFRILLQNNYIATHRRLLSSISLPAEERYLRMLEEYPTIVQRVAQRHIASFLGITPEALSRIRSRLAKRGRS
jgi:CRP-like cAMP-binding protein